MMTNDTENGGETVDDEGVLYKNDFVQVRLDEYRVVLEGRIVAVPAESRVHVQVYDECGPTTDVVRANVENVGLHPYGRLSVLEEECDNQENT